MTPPHPKVPSYEEAERCLDIRRAAKRGDSSYLYVPEKRKFLNYMLKHYPEWYECTDAKIFNDTVPFGSIAKQREPDCSENGLRGRVKK